LFEYATPSTCNAPHADCNDNRCLDRKADYAVARWRHASLLILIDPSHFSGDISGFAGSAGDLAHSDGIDVIGINFNSSQFSDSYDSSTGILTLSDGTNTETLDFTGFKGNVNNFHFADDANGNGTLITDPPGLANSAAVSLVSSEATNSVTI
jgi:hypothetical protein